MNPSETTPAGIALAELTRRRANAAALVGQGRMRRAEAEQAVARWCGIAAWFGAVLPDELSVHPEPVEGPHDGHQLWTDHAPRGLPAAAWRCELAHQLRRDTLTALARYEEFGKTAQAEPLATRARHLLRLDLPLSIAAGLGPICPASAERNAA